MNAEIPETIRARLLRFGVQIPELLTQRKFVSAMCALAYARKRKNTRPGNYAWKRNTARECWRSATIIPLLAT